MMDSGVFQIQELRSLLSAEENALADEETVARFLRATGGHVKQVCRIISRQFSLIALPKINRRPAERPAPQGDSSVASIGTAGADGLYCMQAKSQSALHAAGWLGPAAKACSNYLCLVDNR